MLLRNGAKKALLSQKHCSLAYNLAFFHMKAIKRKTRSKHQAGKYTDPSCDPTYRAMVPPGYIATVTAGS